MSNSPPSSPQVHHGARPRRPTIVQLTPSSPAHSTKRYSETPSASDISFAQALYEPNQAQQQQIQHQRQFKGGEISQRPEQGRDSMTPSTHKAETSSPYFSPDLSAAAGGSSGGQKRYAHDYPPRDAGIKFSPPLKPMQIQQAPLLASQSYSQLSLSGRSPP
ncbi:hypothetical protein LPJ66_008776, partial [Kickxella alabastrina]